MPHRSQARIHRPAPLTREEQLRLVSAAALPRHPASAVMWAIVRCLIKVGAARPPRSEVGLTDRASTPRRDPTTMHPNLVPRSNTCAGRGSGRPA